MALLLHRTERTFSPLSCAYSVGAAAEGIEHFSRFSLNGLRELYYMMGKFASPVYANALAGAVAKADSMALEIRR